MIIPRSPKIGNRPQAALQPLAAPFPFEPRLKPTINESALVIEPFTIPAVQEVEK